MISVVAAVLLLAAPPTVADAGPLWDRCQKGEADACYSLGRLRTVRIPDATARAKATAPFEAACAKKDFAACFALAMHLDDDQGLPIDGRWAFKLFGTACRGGFQPACSREATFYVVGPPSREADANDRALGLYRMACNGGWPAGCGDLVWLSELRGKPLDLTLLVRGCEGGSVSACERLARVESGLPKEAIARALSGMRARLDRLCREGLADACADRDALPAK